MVLWKEVKLSKEVLTQKVNFNPAPQKIEDLPDNSAFPELHHIPTGCPKKKGEAIKSHFSHPVCGARLKVKCVLDSSFNGDYLRHLNFSIWPI